MRRLCIFNLYLLLLLVAGHRHADAARIAPSSRNNPSSRIIGGLPANDVPIPYIVSLITYGYHSCGGSIVNERTVITAAHCLPYTTPRLLSVKAGGKLRDINDGELYSVEAIHYNQNWTMRTMDYDIGLVRVTRSFVYSDKIQPIPLVRSAEETHLRDGTFVTVAGWGYTSILGPAADVLRYARIPIVNQTVCRHLLGNTVTERMLCAGYLRGGIDACQMDSGGPLVSREKLLGLVSWGVGCALPNKPGVYTRISELLPWVDDIMAKEYNEVL